MEVPKLPALDPKLVHAGGGPMPAPVPRGSPESRPPLAPLADAAEVAGAGAVAALADQVHIHPLDLTGAIQILIAEVRADLSLPGDARLLGAGVPPVGGPPSGGGPHGGGARFEPLLLATGAVPEEPLVATAPQSLVQLFLQALPPPESLEPVAWLAAATQMEGAMQVALDRAVAAVTVWRDVPAAVVEAANQTRATVVAAIADETPNPLWLRPEWLGLAPRMERYWRRRRRARQRLPAQAPLRDPDPYWRERDADETDPSG
jgi:hypothetical protein